MPNDDSSTPIAHILGRFNLSFSTEVVSDEHVEHVDPILTQIHEKIHRDLTFCSPFGLFTFLIAHLTLSDPDPIRRYQFRKMRNLLVEHSRDPHEGCAYFSEAIYASGISADASVKVRAKSSERERWATDWMQRAIKPVGLSKDLQIGFAYMLADFALSGPIVRDFATEIPNPDRIQQYLSHSTNSPNERFLAFARAAFFWRRWSLRRCVRRVFDEFCAEQGVKRESLEGSLACIEGPQIMRLNYLMDVALQKWLKENVPNYEILAIDERRPAVQALLDQWNAYLPNLSQDLMSAVIEITSSPAFFEMDDAKLIDPEGLERTYQFVPGFEVIRDGLGGKAVCISVVSPNAFPLVKLNQFVDGRLPPSCLQLCVSIFDPELPNLFPDVGYAWWGLRDKVVDELKRWSTPRTVMIVLWEDVEDCGRLVLGTERMALASSIRVLRTGLVLSEIPNYLASIGSKEFPVRTHIIKSGRKQKTAVLVAKTDQYEDVEFIAPIARTTMLLMQQQQLAPWVVPTLKLEEYESRLEMLVATASACERVVRFGFG